MINVIGYNQVNFKFQPFRHIKAVEEKIQIVDFGPQRFWRTECENSISYIYGGCSDCKGTEFISPSYS